MAASVRKNFASNLRRLLTEQKLTQRKFAEEIGVDEALVSRWLNEKSFPEERNLNLMHEKFRWSYDDLVRDPTLKVMPTTPQVLKVLRELADVYGYDLVRKSGKP